MWDFPKSSIKLMTPTFLTTEPPEPSVFSYKFYYKKKVLCDISIFLTKYIASTFVATILPSLILQAFIFITKCWFFQQWNSLMAQTIKNLPAMQETQVWSLAWEDFWKRKWLPTPVFFPGEFCGQRSWFSPWGCKESDGIAKSQTFMISD